MLLLLSLFIMTLSCGKKDFPDYESSLVHEEQEAGTFRTKFRPLNDGLARNNFSAHSILWSKGFQFYVRIVWMYGTPKTYHYQAIHQGETCPDGRDDGNEDGIIDKNEIILRAGKKLIPLDNSLTTQVLGGEWSPKTNREGNYYYSRSVSVSDLIRDLRAPVTHPHTDLVKLAPGERLDLDRRIIVIYGTLNHPDLPVACGEIEEDF